MAPARSLNGRLRGGPIGAQDEETTGSSQGEGAVAGDRPVRKKALPTQIGAVQADQSKIPTLRSGESDPAEHIMLGGNQAGAIAHQQVGHHRQTTITAEFLLGGLGELVSGEAFELLLTRIGDDQAEAEGSQHGDPEQGAGGHGP